MTEHISHCEALHFWNTWIAYYVIEWSKAINYQVIWLENKQIDCLDISEIYQL